MSPASIPPARISPRLLLGVYGVLPLVVLFIAGDFWVNHGRFSRSLPRDPHALRWFTVFFLLPHIVASALTFVDRDYLRAYRRRLLRGVGVIVVIVVAVPKLIGMKFLLLAIAFYTVYHFIGQQTGITTMLTRDRSRAYQVWRWLTIGAFTILYLAILSKSPLIRRYGVPYATVFFGIYGLSAWTYLRRSKTGIGKLYVVATSAMILVGYLLYHRGLSFYMLLIPRVVHDCTAYVFYIQHNRNRNLQKPASLSAQIRTRLHIPEVLFTPVVSILLAYGIYEATLSVRQIAIAFLALFHYYSEGFMWKNGAPHRRQITF